MINFLNLHQSRPEPTTFNPFAAESPSEPKQCDCWTIVVEWCIRTTENKLQAFEKFKAKMILEDWTQDEIQDSWDEYFV